MNWVYLSLAILSEVIGTLLIRFTEGFARILPTVIMIFFYLLSYYFFNLSIKKMEVGTAYAVWSGLGTALLAILGIIFYKEPFTAIRIMAIVLIILGVIMLHFSGNQQSS
jgi:small multidrug resistance pump